MSGKKVTETPLELFLMANGDIKGIEDRLYSRHGFEKEDKILAASNSQLAVEKLLKGYLKYKNKEPKWGHNLNEYYKQSYGIDNSFADIEDSIHNLNKYDAGLKYTLKIEIDSKTFAETLKDLKKIYNFSAFQEIYNEFVEKKLCDKIPIERFDKMIEEFDYIANNDKTREVECISYIHFENHDDSRLSVKNGYLVDIHDINGLLPVNAVEGAGRKLIYQKDGGQKSYFLERIYKINRQDNFKSDLWEIKGNFSDSNAAAFVKHFEKQ
jgi:HEPN domain-containing protein